jgi:hypothetical protein
MSTPPTADRRRADPLNLTHSSPVMVLSYMITIGFFAVLGAQMYRGDNPDMMIGALIGAFTSGVIGFHFGRSSTDDKQATTISDLTKTAAAVATTAQATQAAADQATLKAGDVKIDADTVTVDGRPT